jgi:hypothetical protein
MSKPVGHLLGSAALVAGRGYAVVLGAWLAWTGVVAADLTVALLAPARVGYGMVSFATALLAMPGYLVAPVVGVACARWIVDGSRHRVLHPWDPTA